MIEDNIWLNYPAQYVIGADEVGRGSFAGPIVACAVKINSVLFCSVLYKKLLREQIPKEQRECAERA